MSRVYNLALGAVGAVVIFAAIVWTLWSIGVVFFGGTVPLTGHERDGNLWLGLVSIVVLPPLAALASYLATVIVLLPLNALMWALERFGNVDREQTV